MEQLSKTERIQQQAAELIRQGVLPMQALQKATLQIEDSEPPETLAVDLRRTKDTVSNLRGSSRGHNRFRVLLYWICVVIYAIAPIASLGSLALFLLGASIWSLLGFFAFGFIGMFALGAARQLEPSVKTR